MENWLLILIMAGGGIVWFLVHKKNEKIRHLKLNANLGYANAQFELGRLYANGKGVEQDIKEAKKWLLKAAMQGHPDAHGVLSLFDDDKEDETERDSVDTTESSETQTEDLFEKFTQQGDAEEQFELGEKHEFGYGVEKNYKKAREHYEKAARLGHVKAQFNLGEMYHFGDDEVEDFAKAIYWYEKAAQQGHEDAPFNLGLLYCHSGDGIEQDYKKAREWYEKASQHGSTVAQFKIGEMYAEGLGVEPDFTKAAEWYEKAAKQGYEEAQIKLDELQNLKNDKKSSHAELDSLYMEGILYCEGIGVEQDFAKVKDLWEKAANQGMAAAQYSLGSLYVNGLGVERDYVKAKEWWKKSANQGDEESQFGLGNLYMKGLGVERDFIKAEEWYGKAAQQGHAAAQGALESLQNVSTEAVRTAAHMGIPAAQFSLSLAYAMGEGVPKDFVQSYMWHTIAIENGFEESPISLEVMSEGMTNEEIKKAQEKAVEMIAENPQLLIKNHN